MKKGKIILLFGISGVGKTYYKNLLSQRFKMCSLKKVTTRPKRKEEEIISVSKEEFETLVEDNKLFISTIIHNEYYGYLKEDIKKIDNNLYLIGDCYYRLIKKLKELLGDNLIIICIQPNKLEDALALIKEQRVDYKRRIDDAKKEYKYFEENKQYIDYYVYTKYNRETDNEIISIVSKIIDTNMEVQKC